uniref:Uncharacterized protein n=1 Tax=Anguilla anguilla TaxID=7936 RepID=A0A0E9QXL7_ANGAN
MHDSAHPLFAQT